MNVLLSIPRSGRYGQCRDHRTPETYDWWEPLRTTFFAG